MRAEWIYLGGILAVLLPVVIYANWHYWRLPRKERDKIDPDDFIW